MLCSRHIKASTPLACLRHLHPPSTIPILSLVALGTVTLPFMPRIELFYVGTGNCSTLTEDDTG